MKPARKREVEEVLERADASLLEIVDSLLNKGVVVNGEVVLGLAGVDLVYLRLSAVLCAADRVDPSAAGPQPKRTPGRSGLAPMHAQSRSVPRRASIRRAASGAPHIGGSAAPPDGPPAGAAHSVATAPSRRASRASSDVE